MAAPPCIFDELMALKSTEARVLINAIRGNRSKNVTLADQLVEYYYQLPAAYLATNVIQAISCHGDRRHFRFMIEVLKDLALVDRNQGQQYAFESAVAGAGRFGLPEDLELLIDAGMPWDDGPVPVKENAEKHIPLDVTSKERKEYLRDAKVEYRFRYRISHSLVAAVLMMLVKRDGRGTRDFHRNYSKRVLKFEGPDGSGAKGLFREAKRRMKKRTQGGFDVIKCVLEALNYRLKEMNNQVFAGSYDPCHRSRSKEDLIAREAFKNSIRHCQECGIRGTISNYGGVVLPLCARCAYMEFRDWIIHSKEFPQQLWELPPAGSPVSSKTMTSGPTVTYLQNRHPELVREIIDRHDKKVRYISEWGPNRASWAGLVGGLTFYCEFDVAEKTSTRRLDFKPTEQWADSSKLPARVRFELWYGDHYLRHERESRYVSEAACLRIVGDLVSEQAEQQWTAPWLVNPETQAPLYVDGYFPAHHLAVEHHGKQHFEPVDFFGGEEQLKAGQRRDEIKAHLLAEHGVMLLVVRYDQVERDTIARLLQEVL